LGKEDGPGVWSGKEKVPEGRGGSLQGISWQSSINAARQAMDWSSNHIRAREETEKGVKGGENLQNRVKKDLIWSKL